MKSLLANPTTDRVEVLSGAFRSKYLDGVLYLLWFQIVDSKTKLILPAECERREK